MVLSHVLRGLFAAGLVSADGTAWGVLDRALYLVHMPMFALIAGTFIPRSVDSRGLGAFSRNRVETLGYLFLLWTLLQGTVEVLTSPVKNVPTTWGQVADLTHPVGHLWFLPFILVASLLTAAVAPWRSRARAAGALAVAAALSLLTWGAVGGIIAIQVLPLLVFVMLGAVIGAARVEAFAGRTPLPVLAAGGLALLVGWVALAVPPSTLIPSEPSIARTVAGLAAGVAGTVVSGLALVMLVGAVSRTIPAVRRALAYCGRTSLQIYLPHIIATAGSRVALGMAGVTHPWVHLIAGTVVGVAAPLVLWIIARRWMPWLYATIWRTGLVASREG
ncbi:acyltransferase [Brachybacterium sp. EF45031]|nr:acyltransferase [Brachybacterium sillae]